MTTEMIQNCTLCEVVKVDIANVPADIVLSFFHAHQDVINPTIQFYRVLNGRHRLREVKMRLVDGTLPHNTSIFVDVFNDCNDFHSEQAYAFMNDSTLCRALPTSLWDCCQVVLSIRHALGQEASRESICLELVNQLRETEGRRLSFSKANSIVCAALQLTSNPFAWDLLVRNECTSRGRMYNNSISVPVLAAMSATAVEGLLGAHRIPTDVEERVLLKRICDLGSYVSDNALRGEYRSASYHV